jgi:hypothetical protein
MLPKLLDVPISRYLMVLEKIRRPSATPVARAACVGDWTTACAAGNQLSVGVSVAPAA